MLMFSCADFTFPVLARREALKVIKLLGFDYVDIGLFARSAHFSPAELLKSPRDYTSRVLRDLEDAGLQPSDVFLQVGVDPSQRAANDPQPHIRAENREIFSQVLEFCQAIGCRHVTGLPGVFHPEISKQVDWTLAIEEAQWRTEQCARAGLPYAIEAHVGSLCHDVKSARAFLRAVAGLTLTLDYGHFVSAGESSSDVHALLPFASHVHLRGGAPGRLQTPVSENTIDFAGMMARLHHLRYDGFLALEYVWIDWNDCNRTDNISETVLLRRWVESTIPAESGTLESDAS